MKLIWSLFVASMILIGCSSNDEQTKEVKNTIQKETVSIAGLTWHLDMQKGFTLAQQEGKDVIVMVGEDDCRWCKKMKERTLIDERIKKKMQAYVLVSIKRSDKKSIQQIPEFDGNIPSFFFMKSNKEMIEPVVGYFKADDFLSYIHEVEESK